MQTDRADSIETQDYSHKCQCPEGNKQCPVVAKRIFRVTNPFERYDEPLPSDSPQTRTEVGQRIACEYHLLHRQELFIKAAHLIGDRLYFAQAQASESAAYNSPQRTSLVTPNDSAAGPSFVSVETYDGVASQAHAVLALTADERRAVDNESTRGFWEQPLAFRTTCMLLFVAAINQGWNETGTNGANPCWLDPLIEPGNAVCKGARDYPTEYGLVNAAVFLGATAGCLISDPLSEFLLGRRRAIMVSAAIILISSLVNPFMTSWIHVFTCRFILGMGMGSKATITPVFLAEIAPSHIRGTTLLNWQIFDAVGIWLGFTANLIASTAGAALAWKWQVASSAIPAFALLVGTFFICWDSPRFLVKHELARFKTYQEAQKRYDAWVEGLRANEHDEDQGDPKGSTPLLQRLKQGNWSVDPAYEYESETFRTLVLLRGSELLAARDLILMHCQFAIQDLSQRQTVAPDEDVNFDVSRRFGWKRRVWDIVSGPAALRREFLAAATVMLGQQLCGINTLVFYSSQLFAQAQGVENAFSRIPLVVTLVLGFLNFLCGIPAYWGIHYLGRRGLLLITLPGMALLMIGAAAVFEAVPGKGRDVGVFVFTLMFVVLYSPGMGPVPFTLSAELFPLQHRVVGMSMAVFVNFGFGALFTVTEPFLNRASTEPFWLFYMFGALNVLVWLMVWLFVREPEDRHGEALALDTMDSIYGRPLDVMRFFTRPSPRTKSPSSNERPSSQNDYIPSNGTPMQPFPYPRNTPPTRAPPDRHWSVGRASNSVYPPPLPPPRNASGKGQVFSEWLMNNWDTELLDLVTFRTGGKRPRKRSYFAMDGGGRD